MKVKKIINELADAVVSGEYMDLVWKSFNEWEPELKGKDVFIKFNKKHLNEDILTFVPRLTPFKDYKLRIKFFNDYKGKLYVSTERIKPKKSYEEMTSSIVYQNGEWIKLKQGKEYIRMVFISIHSKLLKECDAPKQVCRLVSKPVEFIPGNKYSFEFDLPEGYMEELENWKFKKACFYTYNFIYCSDEDEKTQNHDGEDIISFSDTDCSLAVKT